MTSDHAETLDEAVRNLRALILAAETYRQTVASISGLGITETQAVSYLAIHRARGQNDLAADLGLSSGAGTALVDRLERAGLAQRDPHPHDRRRAVVRLTAEGEQLVTRSHAWLMASFAPIPPEDLATFSAALRDLALELRAQSDRQRLAHAEAQDAGR